MSMNTAQADARIQPQADCLLCPVQSCFARGPRAETTAWSAILAPRLSVIPGAPPLFAVGDKLDSLYTVRAGCIKTYTVDSSGGEHIRGFHLPGDLIGLDALDYGRCRSSAVAVVPSQVCVAPLSAVRKLLSAQPSLAQRLTERTSRELALALALCGGFSAEQRLAAFLIHMERRLYSGNSLLRLPMPQRDIGNYLRLATETVCRTLKQFVSRGWVQQDHFGLRLDGYKAIAALAEPIVGPLTAPSFALAA
jgi:CRP/FNR family transcriptional regulator